MATAGALLFWYEKVIHIGELVSIFDIDWGETGLNKIIIRFSHELGKTSAERKYIKVLAVGDWSRT